MPTTPKPERYMVLAEDLAYPATPADVKKRQRGEECDWQIVVQGELRDDIPPMSVAWLLDAGAIARVDAKGNPIVPIEEASE